MYGLMLQGHYVQLAYPVITGLSRLSNVDFHILWPYLITLELSTGVFGFLIQKLVTSSHILSVIPTKLSLRNWV